MSIDEIRKELILEFDFAGKILGEEEEALVVSLKDITKRVRAEEQTQRQLAYLEALHNIDIAIASSVDLDLTIAEITNQTQAMLKVDAVSLLTYDPHLQEFTCRGREGFKTEALEHTRLRLGQGLAERAAREYETLHIPDLREEDAYPFTDAPELEKEGFVAYWGVPLIAKGDIKGVLEIFHRAPLSPSPEWSNFLATLAGQAAIGIENSNLFIGIQEANQNLSMAYDTTLEGWAKALEYRDMETEGHSRRVTNTAVRLARSLGLEGNKLLYLRRGALLHDIGKMGVPDNILQKTGPLDDDEWAIMHQHPIYAFDMLKSISYLRHALDIPRYHHERWDGSGYHRGQAGEEIPLPARIFAIVDVWDALLSDRPYRDAWPEEKALAHIRDQSGKHFDPRVVKAFLELEK